MLNFELYTPTKIVFGKHTERQVGELIKDYDAKKVLVHYGGESAKRSGLLDKIYDSLNASQIEYVSLGGVVPNPRLSKVNEGIELCQQESVDFILAVGGGSVIDSAKSIGYGIVCGGDVWDFYNRTREITGCLPIGCVLTIAAAGSEMSNSAVLTNEDGWLKRGALKSDFGRPRFAVLNPELTYTLPQYQTASGCVDILMHTMERYFNNSTMELTDHLSEALMRTVIMNSKILMNQPNNYHARAEIMWAGSLSHNGLLGCGTDGGDWASHQMEHELGGMFDVAHGAGLAAIWGSWARYVYKENVERFAQFAANVFDIPCGSNLEDAALAGIKATEHFYRLIDMPTSLAELGVHPTDEQIDTLAYNCAFKNTRTVGIIKKLNFDDIAQIYTIAK